MARASAVDDSPVVFENETAGFVFDSKYAVRFSRLTFEQSLPATAATFTLKNMNGTTEFVDCTFKLNDSSVPMFAVSDYGGTLSENFKLRFTRCTFFGAYGAARAPERVFFAGR